MSYRIGLGTDFHQLVEGRKLWLGGIEIPHHKGATGHSDADVLLHAICDALLGALNLGDIGIHFPDTDARSQGYRQQDSAPQNFSDDTSEKLPCCKSGYSRLPGETENNGFCI